MTRRESAWPGRLALLSLAAAGALVIAAWMRSASIDVGALTRRNPGATALMRQREREAAEHGRGYRPRRTWTSYDRISPLLRRAVLIAEDDAFYSHDGLDWNEIRVSAKTNLTAGRIVRGGSTITQQLAKNLWLDTSRSPLRKLEELFLALRLEREVGKRRIFELYLNEIEWGDGVFGAEAAARHWFHTSAAGLDARESVLLAAVIINPRRFSPLDPPRRIERRVRMIASRMRRRGELSDLQWRQVLGLPFPENPPPVALDTLPATPATPVESLAVGDTTAPAESVPPADSIPG
jgi:monofunctional biosynthetic peptidoglycan transglycosylase